MKSRLGFEYWMQTHNPREAKYIVKIYCLLMPIVANNELRRNVVVYDRVLVSAQYMNLNPNNIKEKY